MSASSDPPSPDHDDARRRGKRPLVMSSSSEDDGKERVAMAPLAQAQVECFVCGRVFGTWKGLCGHMRCHPERGWRGLRPRQEGEGSVGTRKRRREAQEVAVAVAVAASLVKMQEKEEVPGLYGCGECGRSFSTRQALGGHRASHRGVIGCSARAKGMTAGPSSGEGRHPCEDCGMRFATYHEMSIHRRVHRRAGGEEGGATRREGKGRVLDLNLPPPDEEDNNDEFGKKGS
ncbi:hypothetical protein HPP92_025504 [Vanilla planifolia]|uniref:C2H2-type domain-containing protein n=2 Tax=Vanilla planifolia TaxID=51239 RepID=A0A835PFI0_VANPL|nr:hypothetical protein HPP92_025504 [Vanilla planifolia]